MQNYISHLPTSATSVRGRLYVNDLLCQNRCLSISRLLRPSPSSRHFSCRALSCGTSNEITAAIDDFVSGAKHLPLKALVVKQISNTHERILWLVTLTNLDRLVPLMVLGQL